MACDCCGLIFTLVQFDIFLCETVIHYNVFETMIRKYHIVPVVMMYISIQNY